jgi:hypothetical protein
MGAFKTSGVAVAKINVWFTLNNPKWIEKNIAQRRRARQP